MSNSQATLEQRVDSLEKQVATMMERFLAPTQDKDWRSAVGTLKQTPEMREIDELGREIREAEREEARRDHS